MEKKGWKVIAIIFIILFGLASLTAWWNIKQKESADLNVKSCWDNLEKNYDYKCGDGYKKVCLDSNQQISYCRAGESTACYDYKLQSFVVCNKLDNLEAQCVPKGYGWIKCPTGSYQGCYDNNGKWVSSI